MCLIRGSFGECVTQVFELVYSSLFSFLPSFLFTHPLSAVEHDPFSSSQHSLLAFSSSHTFPGSSSCFSLFATIIKSSANARHQTFFLPTTLSSAGAFFNISSPYLPHYIFFLHKSYVLSYT
jgi:hypothetical protein